MKTKLMKGTPAYYINSVIVLLLMFCFRFIPAPAPITELGMACLGIFLGAVWGWITVGMLWPSLMGLIAYGFSGYCTISEAFSNGFSHNNTLTLIIIFGILGIMESAGLTEWIALKIVHLRIGQGRPWVIVFLLFLASFVLVALTCSWASAMFVWSVFYKMVQANAIEKGKYTAFVIGVVMVGAILGGQVFPFAVPVMLVTGAYTGVAGIESAPAFVPYVVWMIVVCIVIAVVYLLVGKFILKVKAPQVDTEKIEKAKPLNRYQGIVLICLGIFLVGLVFASLFPKTGLGVVLNQLGVKGFAALLIALLIALNFTDGKRFGDYMKGANWELIFVMALICVMSASLTADGTGIMPFVAGVFAPIMTGHGVIVFLLLITLIPLILTNVLNNLVIGMLFVPIATTFSMQMGINTDMMFCELMLLTSCALATPAGCAVAALYHGNNEWTTAGQATKYGILFAAIAWVCTLIVGVPLGSILF